MASSGQIRVAEILDEKAILVFQELDKVVKTLNDDLDKLRKKNEELGKSLGNAKTSTQRLTITNKILKNEAQINKLLEDRYALELKGIALQQRAAKIRQDQMTSMNKLNTIASKFATASFIVGSVKGLFDTFENIIVKVDSFNNLMTKVTGSAYGASRAMEYLIKTSKDFGLNLNDVVARYSKFFAAAEQSGLTLEETNAIFTSLSKTAGTLGLDMDETRGVFLALEQMLSKGKVTTEELRRQLGERVPGAVGIMAKAVQALHPELRITTAELDKMLKKGEVISAEVLPEFARQLEIAYGILEDNRVDTLRASINNAATAWQEFVITLERGSGPIGTVFEFVYDSFTKGVEALTRWSKAMAQAEGLQDTLATQAGIAVKVLNLIPWGKALNELTGANDAVAEWEQALADANDEAVKHEILVNSLMKLYIDKSIVDEVAIDQQTTMLRLKALTNEELEKELDFLTKKVELDKELLTVAEGTADYYELKIKKAKEDLDSLIKINEQTGKVNEDQEKQAELLRTNIKLWQQYVDTIRGKEKKGPKDKKEKEFKLDFGTLDTEKGIQDYIKLFKELRELESDPKRRAEMDAHLTDLERQAKAMERQVYTAEQLNEILAERERLREGPDEGFDFNTFERAFGGVGAEIGPQMEGFQAMMPIFLDEYKAMYGADLSNAKEFLKEKLAEYMKFQEDFTETDAEILKKKQELQQEIFDQSVQLGNELLNFALASQAAVVEGYQAEQEELTRTYDMKRMLAEGDAERQHELDVEEALLQEELRKKELKARQKMAKWEKAQALFNALAQGAVSIARVSWNPVLTALTSAIVAAQVAAILKAPLPQYKHGRMGGPAELAIVGDGGRSEVISGKRGTFLTPDKPTITKLDRGDRVFRSKKAYEDHISRSLTGRPMYKGVDLETSIARGFKKATVNNYIKPPKVIVNIDHSLWVGRNSQFGK